MLHEKTIEHITGLSDAELVEYVLTGERVYEPEAIAFAKAELERRKLPHEQVAAVRPAVVAKLARMDAEAPPNPMKPRAVSAIVCQACGLEVPNRYVEYDQNIGAFHIRFYRTYRGYFCRRCNHRFFWKSSLITLGIGWFGLVSMFVTPAYLLGNMITCVRTFGLPKVPRDERPPVCDDAAVDKIAPFVLDITDRLTAGADAAEICRELAPKAGLTPGQVWVYVQQTLINQVGNATIASGVTFRPRISL